jgi:hypothetical protein
MSTLRVSGPLDLGRGPIGMLVRMIAASSLLCAVVFIAGFALGRTSRPGVAAGEPPAAGLPATAAGPAIPLALSSAPAIAIEAPVPVRRTLHASLRGPVVSSGALPATASLGVSSAPVAEVPTAPAAPVSSHTRSTGAGSSHASGGTKSGTSGGTSFDSSG